MSAKGWMEMGAEGAERLARWRAETEAAATAFDLAAFGWGIRPEDARNLARWEGKTHKEFARDVAQAFYEMYLSRREPMPVTRMVLARAIEARMQEE